MAMTVAERQLAYHHRHPERRAVIHRAWRERNLEWSRQDSRERERRRRGSVKEEAVAALGGKCSRCGFSDHRALQIDHINNDGHKERKTFGNDLVALRRRAMTEIKSGKYCLLCANCNVIKESERRQMSRLEFDPSLKTKRVSRRAVFSEPQIRRGSAVPNAKTNDEQVMTMRILYAEGAQLRQLCNKFSLGLTTVWKVVRGQSWRHVGGPISGPTHRLRMGVASGPEDSRAELVRA